MTDSKEIFPLTGKNHWHGGGRGSPTCGIRINGV